MSDPRLTSFYTCIPRFTQFANAIDHKFHARLPDGWLVGVSDVIDSTGAIEAGRYKTVNMVGASVISAVRNALDGALFPFVFGGDGAALAIPDSLQQTVGDALARVQVWAKEEVGLSLRVALVPIDDIRAAGRDVAVARLQVAPEVSYPMFSGGGIAWAEAAMKAGAYALPPAAPGSRPNLEGLSCRWNPIEARQGDIVSLLAVPARDADIAQFEALVRTIVKTIDADLEREGHPVPEAGPRFAFIPKGVDLEARASPGARHPLLRRARIALFSLFVYTLFRTGRKIGGFDPVQYGRDTARNSDYRKLDDGLKLTLDCTTQVIEKIETILQDAHANGIANYGLHRQKTALMTCIVPSATSRDHMHFIDGAQGGYARAAEMLKAQLARAS